jgi:hypothetical protein
MREIAKICAECAEGSLGSDRLAKLGEEEAKRLVNYVLAYAPGKQSRFEDAKAEFGRIRPPLIVIRGETAVRKIYLDYHETHKMPPLKGTKRIKSPKPARAPGLKSPTSSSSSSSSSSALIAAGAGEPSARRALAMDLAAASADAATRTRAATGKPPPSSSPPAAVATVSGRARCAN